jgi:hypothetical protein
MARVGLLRCGAPLGLQKHMLKISYAILEIEYERLALPYLLVHPQHSQMMRHGVVRSGLEKKQAYRMSDTLVMLDVVSADPTGLASPSLYFLQMLFTPSFLRIFPLKLSRFLMLSLPLLLHHLLHSHLLHLLHPPMRLAMVALPRHLPS